MDEEFACDWCDAEPGEACQPDCPYYDGEIDADDLKFCSVCGISYTVNCLCDLQGE